MQGKGEKRHLTQREAAKVFGVSEQRVGQILKPGGLLEGAACMVSGRRVVDMFHSDAVSYLARRRGAAPVAPPPPPMPTLPLSTAEFAPSSLKEMKHQDEIRECWGMTVGEVIGKYGSLPAFADLMKGMDKVESIQARRFDTQRKSGELISREFVKKQILGLVERTNQRLLTDLPATLASDVLTMCENGTTREALTEEIKRHLSRELLVAKNDTRKAIKRATYD